MSHENYLTENVIIRSYNYEIVSHNHEMREYYEIENPNYEEIEILP